jgi:hypothetical protein
MIFKHGEGDKVVTYKKMGECRHCGECCSLACPQFTWEVLRNIRRGEIIEAGIDQGTIRSRCNVFDKTTHIEGGCTPEVRANFPSSPFSTLPSCGFYWVVVEES